MPLTLADVVIPETRITTIKIGTVTSAPGTGVVTVNIDGGSLVLPHMRGYAPAVNDIVMIAIQGSRRYVIDAITNPAAPITPRGAATAPSQPTPKPPAPPKPKVVKGTRTFLAQSTADYRSGWRTDTKQPHQGDYGGWGNNTGCWFYGSQIHTALKGAHVISAKIYMRRVSGGDYAGQSATLWLTPHGSRPGGAPTLAGAGVGLSSLAVNTGKWMTLNRSYAQLLIDTYYGLAVHISGNNPYMVFANLSETRSSGAIQITYQK